MVGRITLPSKKKEIPTSSFPELVTMLLSMTKGTLPCDSVKDLKEGIILDYQGRPNNLIPLAPNWPFRAEIREIRKKKSSEARKGLDLPLLGFTM